MKTIKAIAAAVAVITAPGLAFAQVPAATISTASVAAAAASSYALASVEVTRVRAESDLQESILDRIATDLDGRNVELERKIEAPKRLQR